LESTVGLRAQLGWLRHGAQRTNEAMEAYATELRDLQLKVESLTSVVARLDATLAGVDRSTSDEIDAMKVQLRTITDDLGDRLGALSARLDAAPRP
jgi:hypothetical protein